MNEHASKVSVYPKFFYRVRQDCFSDLVLSLRAQDHLVQNVENVIMTSENFTRENVYNVLLNQVWGIGMCCTSALMEDLANE